VSKGKVLVAMSGGVDSSVALSRLLDDGYDAFGVTMKLWENKDPVSRVVRNSNCNTVEAINGAKMVCDRLGVHHYTLDFIDIFRTNIVNDFANEYLSGRTPNPCVRCNSIIKWETLLKQADIFKADFIATGHYACIVNHNGESRLKKGLDAIKDQSYMLWQVKQEALARTLLPLGEMTKNQVRDYAQAHNLETAQTPESMDLCFVNDDDYNRFLYEIMPEQMENISSGEILNETGETVGQHTGFTNYTIGQRRGLGLSNPEPRYVKEINPLDNTVTVAKKESMFDDTCFISDLNWFIDEPKVSLEASVRIRYNSKGSIANIIRIADRFKIKFREPQLAITPGQSAVFYQDDIVLGGGIIETE